MRRPPRRFAPLAALEGLCLALALCAGLAVGRAGPPPEPRPRISGDVPTTVGVLHGPVRLGTAVYPAQRIPVRFTHGQHLAIPGVTCARCHVDVARSTRVADGNLPRGATCDGCHGPQHPKPADAPARCELCHTRYENGRVVERIVMPTPRLRFNHQLHMARGAMCGDCHRNMDKVRLATTLQLPREADCLKCHDGAAVTNRCSACHPSGPDGRIDTRPGWDRRAPRLVPRGASSWGIEHDLNFVEDHGPVSKANPKLCASCHDDDFCQDCHAGATRPLRIHAADFMTTHAMEARGRTQDCQSCHRVQTFCLGCHERLGFGERGRGSFGVGGSLRFHPDGWAAPPGLPQGHAHPAQRNVSACASCHAEDTCLACHATSEVPAPGLGVNPHGRGFAQSSRCTALSARNKRVCLKCHLPGDPRNDCL